MSDDRIRFRLLNVTYEMTVPMARRHIEMIKDQIREKRELVGYRVREARPVAHPDGETRRYAEFSLLDGRVVSLWFSRRHIGENGAGVFTLPNGVRYMGPSPMPLETARQVLRMAESWPGQFCLVRVYRRKRSAQ